MANDTPRNPTSACDAWGKQSQGLGEAVVTGPARTEQVAEAGKACADQDGWGRLGGEAGVSLRGGGSPLPQPAAGAH